jgi:Ribosomal protein L19e
MCTISLFLDIIQKCKRSAITDTASAPGILSVMSHPALASAAEENDDLAAIVAQTPPSFPPHVSETSESSQQRTMVSLKLQKRLAAAVLECGRNKVWLDPNEINEICMANSSTSFLSRLTRILA